MTDDEMERRREPHDTVVAKNNDSVSGEELRAILTAGGVQLVPRPVNGRKPLSEEARAALRREIGPGVNASQAIIEERESGW